MRRPIDQWSCLWLMCCAALVIFSLQLSSSAACPRSNGTASTPRCRNTKNLKSQWAVAPPWLRPRKNQCAAALPESTPRKVCHGPFPILYFLLFIYIFVVWGVDRRDGAEWTERFSMKFNVFWQILDRGRYGISRALVCLVKGWKYLDTRLLIVLNFCLWINSLQSSCKLM